MIPAGVKISAATSPVDMRRGFVGLAEAAREGLGRDPAGGALFLFFNKRKDRVKLLWHDRTGRCLPYKGLDRGFFRIPEAEPDAKAITIDGRELAAILEGVQLPERKARAQEIAQKARDAVLRVSSAGAGSGRGGAAQDVAEAAQAPRAPRSLARGPARRDHESPDRPDSEALRALRI